MATPADPSLAVGASLEENAVLNPTRIHDLVEQASLSNMSVSAMYTGLDCVRAGAEGTPSAGDTYVDTDGVLQVYDGSAYADLGMPAAFTVTFRNAEGSALTRGMAAILSPTSTNRPLIVKSSIATVDPTIGIVWDASIADGADGQVLIRGVMTDCVAEFTSSSNPAGSYIQGPTTGRSYCLIDKDPTDTPNTWGSSYIGMTLEDVNTSGLATFAAYIWR